MNGDTLVSGKGRKSPRMRRMTQKSSRKEYLRPWMQGGDELRGRLLKENIASHGVAVSFRRVPRRQNAVLVGLILPPWRPRFEEEEWKPKLYRS